MIKMNIIFQIKIITFNLIKIQWYVFWTVWSDSEIGSSTWSQDKKNYNNADNYRILQKLSHWYRKQAEVDKKLYMFDILDTAESEEFAYQFKDTYFLEAEAFLTNSVPFTPVNWNMSVLPL